MSAEQGKISYESIPPEVELSYLENAHAATEDVMQGLETAFYLDAKDAARTADVLFMHNVTSFMRLVDSMRKHDPQRDLGSIITEATKVEEVERTLADYKGSSPDGFSDPSTS
jgi:hypothetical protein